MMTGYEVKPRVYVFILLGIFGMYCSLLPMLFWALGCAICDIIYSVWD